MSAAFHENFSHLYCHCRHCHHHRRINSSLLWDESLRCSSRMHRILERIRAKEINTLKGLHFNLVPHSFSQRENLFSRAICKITLFPRYLQLIPEWETVAKSFHTGPDRLPNTDTRFALASFVTLANKKARPLRWQRYHKAGCANAYAHPPDGFSKCSLAITADASRVIKNDG